MIKGLLPRVKLNSQSIGSTTRTHLTPAVIALNHYINLRTFARQEISITCHLMTLTRESAWMALALAYEKTPLLSAHDLLSEGAILCETMDGRPFLLSYLNKTLSEPSRIFDIHDAQLPQDEPIRSLFQPPPTPPSSFFQRTNQWIRDHFSFVNGVSSFAMNYFQGMSIAFSLVQGIISTLLMEIFTRSRKYYLNSAAHYYDSADKLSKITHDREKLALKAGEQAKTWSGYLWSFGNYRTYIHPQAFAAGLKFGVENNHEISYCIRRLR